MKSCWIVTKGHDVSLEFRDIPQPKPGPGQIVIRTHASSLNRGELFAGGVVHGGPEKLGGTEAAGIVHAVGEGVTACKPGDRVMGRARGGWAEYSLMDIAQVMPAPPRLTWEQAGGASSAYITAYELLWPPYGNLVKGEWLLITGVSSGVGVACVQCAKHVLGANVIATSRSAEKLAALMPLGIDEGIVTGKPDFAAKVKAATGGKGADLAVNLVGGSMFAECVRASARQGRIAVVGYVDSVFKAEIDLSAVHAARLEIYGISNAQLTADERAAAARGFARDVVPAYADGRITPVVDQVFAFDDLPRAKARMDSNAASGKIVVRIA